MNNSNLFLTVLEVNSKIKALQFARGRLALCFKITALAIPSQRESVEESSIL